MRALIAILVMVAGCSTEEPDLPAPIVDEIRPKDVCGDDARVDLFVNGSRFLVNEDHTVDSVLELWRDGRLALRRQPPLEWDFDGHFLELELPTDTLGPGTTSPAREYEVRVVNPDGKFGVSRDPFRVHAGVYFEHVTPRTVTRGATVTLNLVGSGFYPPMTMEIETQRPVDLELDVTSQTTATVTYDVIPEFPTGSYAITIRNAGGCKQTLVSAFTVLP